MAKILIVGGSLGGLFVANLLHRAGHEVRVFERVAGSMDGRGAGIVTHPALHAALIRAGLSAHEPLGVAVQGRVVLARDGSTLQRLAMPQILTSWSRLWALLKDLLPLDCYVGGATLTSLSQTDTQTRAQFAIAGANSLSTQANTGTHTETADLLIGCDGIRSRARGMLAPTVNSAYAGYVAWRGVCDEAVLSQRTRNTLFDHFGFGMADAEQILGYPVAGAGNATHPGQRRYNYVWYRNAPAPTALAALMTDADGRHHPDGISPAQVSYQHIAAMRQAAHAQLAPQWAEVLEKSAQPFLQPIHDLVSEQIAFGRVALVGDAAFVARPHVGMGVTKAALDACALADSLAAFGATPQALQHYQAQQLPFGHAIVQRSRELGASMRSANADTDTDSDSDSDSDTDTDTDTASHRHTKDPHESIVDPHAHLRARALFAMQHTAVMA